MKKVNDIKPFFALILALIILRPSLDILVPIEFQIHPSLPYLNLNILIGGSVFALGAFFVFKNLRKIISTPLFWPVCIFLALGAASIIYSINKIVSITEFVRLSSIFLLYFLSFNILKTKKEWLLMLKAILLSYALPAVFALVQLIFGIGKPDEISGYNRIFGTFAHPNLFAFYTFFILGLAISLLLSCFGKNRDSNKIPPHFLLPASFLLLVLLFATFTRSAIACLFIFLFIFGIFRYRKIILIGILIFIIAYLFSDIFQERVWDTLSLDPAGSIVWRLRLWTDVLPVALWQPIQGYGLGTFTQIVEFYRGFRWGSLDAHNDYLKTFVENGILGLSAYLWLILAVLFSLFKIFRKTKEQDKNFALGILIIFFSLYIASSFDNILRTTALQWNLWILLGGWLKMHNENKKRA